jgi:hypothetical protein
LIQLHKTSHQPGLRLVASIKRFSTRGRLFRPGLIAGQANTGLSAFYPQSPKKHVHPGRAENRADDDDDHPKTRSLKITRLTISTISGAAAGMVWPDDADGFFAGEGARRRHSGFYGNDAQGHHAEQDAASCLLISGSRH